MILVNRPFLAVVKKLPSSDMFPCQTTCSYAASCIARLLQIFDRLYTLRRINVQAVHLIFTASVIHVYNACTSTANPTSRDAAATDLDICCHALREMGQFKNAARALEVTIYLKAELLKRSRRNNKRPSFSTRAQEEYSSKRLCFDPDTVSSRRGNFSTEELNSIDADNEGLLGSNFEGNLQLDSLFWADFTTIEMDNNVTWN
jgi:hypothetical protein